MKNLYFVAHQDDELLNTGVLLTKEVQANYDDTYVILCTDGGGSGVFGVLCNGEDCWLHEGKHIYPLSRQAFSHARDREFSECCSLLGVKKTNVIIHEKRGLDGSLSEEQAELIILETMKLFPDEEDFRIRAVSPCFYGRQNPDHKAIGVSCEKLFGLGLFSEMLLVTDSCFEGNCREIFPKNAYEDLIADELSFERIKAAADCYGRWEPQNSRYAIGWHSVKDEFEEIVKNPKIIFYKKEKSY